MRLLGTQKKKQANGQKQIKMGQAKGESWIHRFGQGAIMPCPKWAKSEQGEERGILSLLGYLWKERFDRENRWIEREHKSPTAVRQGSCALLTEDHKRRKKREEKTRKEKSFYQALTLSTKL